MLKENTIQYYDKEFLKEEHEKNQLVLIKNETLKANISLLNAKNNIEDELKFDRHIKDVFNYLHNKNSNNEYFLIKREAYFTCFLHAFHFNYPYLKIKNFLEQIINIDLLNKTENFEPYFYLFLLQIINGDYSGKINFFHSKPARYYEYDETNYFYKFLDGVRTFKEGKFKSAKLRLISASNTPNNLINSWSRQLLAVINFKQGNIDLVIKLISKENKYLLSNPSKSFFTINSSVFFISLLSKQLFLPIPHQYQKQISKIKVASPLHYLLFNEINTNRTN